MKEVLLTVIGIAMSAAAALLIVVTSPDVERVADHVYGIRDLSNDQSARVDALFADFDK